MIKYFRGIGIKGKLFLVLFSLVFSYQVIAALPALAVLPEVLSFASGLVVRQVAKQTIVTVGVAANDAAWATAGGGGWIAGLAAFIGLGTFVSNAGTEQYIVPVNSSVSLPVGGNWPQDGSILMPTTANGVRLNGLVFAGKICCVSGGSIDISLNANVLNFEDYLVKARASVDAALASNVGTFPQYVDSIQSNAGRVSSVSAPNGSGAYVQVYIPQLCASAQNGLGAVCSNSSTKWLLVEPKDGVRRFKIQQGGLVADITDPDWSDREKSIFANPTVIVFRGSDSTGQPVRIDVSAPNNIVQVNAVSQNGSTVKFRQMSFAADGTPGTVAEAVVPNATVDTFYDQNPSYSPTTSTSAQPVTVQFPSDYARQGEAAQAATQVSAQLSPKLDQIHTDLTTQSTLDDPVAPTWVDPWGDSFTSFLGWRLPAHSSECPKPSFVWPWTGETMAFTTQCDLATSYMGVISSVMAAVWLVLGLRIVLKA